MRRLAPDEKALWQKVVATVRPLHPSVEQAEPAREPVEAPPPPARLRAAPRPAPRPAKPVPGITLDGSWDRRLSRGLVQPDLTVDLHGHNLDTAYSLLDFRLDQAVATGARVLLLITGKPPSPTSGRSSAAPFVPRSATGWPRPATPATSRLCAAPIRGMAGRARSTSS